NSPTTPLAVFAQRWSSCQSLVCACTRSCAQEIALAQATRRSPSSDIDASALGVLLLGGPSEPPRAPALVWMSNSLGRQDRRRASGCWRRRSCRLAGVTDEPSRGCDRPTRHGSTATSTHIPRSGF